MSYTVVRALAVGAFSDRFKKVEDDTDFKVESHAELDEYLTTQEARGWTVVNVAPVQTSSGSVQLYITMHRPDA